MAIFYTDSGSFVELSVTGSLQANTIDTTDRAIIGGSASVHPGNEEKLAVYQGVTTSYNLISGHSDINSYSQLNIKNFNTGSNASSDVVATADNGDESTGFIDMGINSSGYTNAGLVGDANDAYLYSTGENLLIGNATPGKQVVIFNGGTDAAGNAKMYIHDTNVGVIGINTDTIGDINNPAALRILPPNNNTFNMVETEADLNGFVQSVFSNINAGPSASSDIVAHNDSGSTFAYYIDMGINSSTYNQDYVGGPNDTYIIGAGEHMHIGNIGHTPGSDASLYLYTGGTTDDYTRVYISASGLVGVNTLTPEYQFDVSGSGRYTNGLRVTGSLIAPSITGSLQGSASYALTASYALNGGGGGGSAFPYTGSAIVSGSLSITGSFAVSNSIDASNRWLYNQAGGVVTLDWQNHTLQDGSSVVSIDWNARNLNDPGGATSLDWENRYLLTPGTRRAFAFSNDYVAQSQIYHSQTAISQAQEDLSTAVANFSGQAIIATIHGSSSTGFLVYLATDGTWYPVDQTTDTSTKLLGINLDGSSVLLDGDVILEEGVQIQAPDHGLPVYIKESTTTGQVSTVPTTSGYVRVLGHCYYQNTGTTTQWIVKFRPSNDWYQI